MKARLNQGYVCAAPIAAVGCFVILAANGSAQEAAATDVAEVERVIVTGSHIPTAEETGPNPVDTYRPADIEKLGVRNATDFLTRLPQEMGATLNQNTSNIPVGIGDGTVQVNLRGLLPRETLVLIDGKRVAGASLSGNGAIDINLIPFSMIDHIDILKDGASAVYGADAVAGVFNIFLVHKFRGLEIGGSYGNTNLAPPTIWASGRDGSKLARAMTRLRSWSLPISTTGPPSTAATVTLVVTRSWVCFSEALITAARISLAAFKTSG
jgi:outer membrane receptor for ferrienterochelin and colicin